MAARSVSAAQQRAQGFAPDKSTWHKAAGVHPTYLAQHVEETFFRMAVSGGRGIRTHDGCYPIAVFKTAAIGH